MKVLVTGGLGRIGRVVADEIAQAHDVTVMDVAAGKSPHPVITHDLTKPRGLAKKLKGFDAIAHLAAIPDPFSDPQQKVLSTNMLVVFNILEAAVAAKVPKVVYGSSESATGFGCRPQGFTPPIKYIPIDEKHPVLPAEAYAFTKYFGELMCHGFSAAYGIETVSLRYCWVMTDDAVPKMKKEMESIGEIKNLFRAYVGVRDVARAYRAAIETSNINNEVFLLTADDHYGETPILEIIQKALGKLPPIHQPERWKKNPFASVFDCSHAKERLGWQPKQTWREMVKGL